MDKGREAINFRQSGCKKPRIVGLLTLRTRGQSPQDSVLQNAYMAIAFDQGDGLSKEVLVGQEWKPKLWTRGR